MAGFSFYFNLKIRPYIEEELSKGFIRPSTSPASAGFFFVSKKDGGLCPCIDCCGLSKITVKYWYPLSLVLAVLEHLWTSKLEDHVEHDKEVIQWLILHQLYAKAEKRDFHQTFVCDVGNHELLAVKAAFKEWQHWLEGAKHPILVLTDSPWVSIYS